VRDYIEVRGYIAVRVARMIDVFRRGGRYNPSIVVDFKSVSEFRFGNLSVRNDSAFYSLNNHSLFDSLGGNEGMSS
jgi:hypothetical protein